MSEQTSVKELLEVLEGLKVVASLAGKVGADGRVDLSDLQYLASAAQDLPKLIAAVDGAGKVVSEVKDLDEAEIAQVLAKVLELVSEVKAAIPSKS